MAGIPLPSLITFAVYLALMIGIGIYCYRETRTLGDFILGGRRLGPATTAFSAHASDSSGYLLLGLPGWAYTSGLDGFWMVFGLALGIYGAWKFLAARLRRYTEAAGNALTISSFLENRFEDHSRALRIVSAIIILVFYTLYVSSGLVAGGLLFDEVFGLDFVAAAAVSAIVIVAYTFIGGFLAVSYTDVVQGLLMVVALVVVPVVAILAIGGIGGLTEGMTAREPALLRLGEQTAFDAETGTWSAAGGFGLVTILSSLAWGLGYFGQPHILARFMAIRSADEMPTAMRIGMTWVIVSMVGAMLVGFAGIAYYDTPLSDPETVFLTLTSSVLSPWIAGVLLAAVLAAIMSTADSQLLVASSALTEDLYRGIVKQDASETHLVWLGRILVVVVAVIAFALALEGGSVLDLVGYAWAGFGAAFGPLILISLYWSGVSRSAAIAGMASGAVVVVAWRLSGVPFGLYEIIPGCLASTAMILGLSRAGAGRHPSPAATDPLRGLGAEGRA